MRGFIARPNRIAAAALIILISAVLGMGTAFAASNVTIMTPPIGTQDLTLNGTHIGTFPLYDGTARLTFSWTPYWPAFWPTYPNPQPTNHSYRVAVWQNVSPPGAAPNWVELHTSHHWIDDPNPTRFTMDTFLETENLCDICPSVIIVQAETIQPYLDPSGTTQYNYIPASVPNTYGVPALMKSDPILIQGSTRIQDTKQPCPLPPKLQWVCLLGP